MIKGLGVKCQINKGILLIISIQEREEAICHSKAFSSSKVLHKETLLIISILEREEAICHRKAFRNSKVFHNSKEFHHSKVIHNSKVFHHSKDFHNSKEVHCSRIMVHLDKERRKITCLVVHIIPLGEGTLTPVVEAIICLRIRGTTIRGITIPKDRRAIM